MKERRRFERYKLTLPARMETISLNKKRVYELKTKNVSACGAFIDTKSPFPEGMRIKMSLTTKSKRIIELTGSGSLIECEGIIIRSNPAGIAVCFDKECQILNLKDL